ncbi:3-keto-disaccharide hydrolase [Glaciecola sp. 1036]|uniref:3-keto-disaccharide hydrolase n=1 Tax=Alteromonadaceae TaxID=72275 RepID=UPI003D00BE59
MKFLLLFTLILFSCSNVAKSSSDSQWTPLLDKNLSQWEAYLSYRHKLGYNGEIPKNDEGEDIAPFGLLKHPQEYGVYTVDKAESKANGTPVLKVSGEIYGGLTTLKSYRNYRFKLKFKWGDKVYEPRKKLLKDSGILYHGAGEHGKEYWRSWMVSQEFQIMRGHIGDYWSQGNSAIDIRAFIPEYIMNPVADETQDYISVGEKQANKGFVLRKENHEKPEGQWNELELICFEGKSLHIVNGEVVMVLANSRTLDENGIAHPLIEGKIQLQSEAAEIFYKDIYILEIEAIPSEFRQLF